MSVKDLEKFVRHFVLKCVQVIVQSRLGSNRIKTDSNKRGNDWFNLAINDIKDINEQSKKCLEAVGGLEVTQQQHEPLNQSLVVIKTDWKICCEISMKTTEGQTMTLEYWFVANEAYESNNATNLNNNNNQSPPSPSMMANSPTLIIYNIYNKMSLMLKSLISVTRATPAYKLSQKGQSADSYVICYRVYNCDPDFNILESMTNDELQHYSSLKPLGSIKSAFNELSVSFIYRTDLSFDPKISNENITPNIATVPKSPQLLPVKNDHFQKEEKLKTHEVKDQTKPLTPAFASDTQTEILPSILPELDFGNLLSYEMPNDSLDSSPKKMSSIDKLSPKKSEPIVIPKRLIDTSVNTCSPNYCSSGDSFVFVDFKPPFAPKDDETLPPSILLEPPPQITTSIDSLADLSLQLAEIESNVQDFDNFIQSVCSTDNDDQLKDG
ncbi:autophagy-related protein 13 homolog [Oppia nitens]|uniref:autophagy-related protein 13 homolog n=1 Tax=Oppia nitens TaxID=1686743 RepID=UPI0023DC071D|nr:autophagy-related protein 13 homolog [Oppia nitens]